MKNEDAKRKKQEQILNGEIPWWKKVFMGPKDRWRKWKSAVTHKLGAKWEQVNHNVHDDDDDITKGYFMIMQQFPAYLTEIDCRQSSSRQQIILRTYYRYLKKALQKKFYIHVSSSTGHLFVLSHHFLCKLVRKSFSCRRKMARVKSFTCGSLAWKASASPFDVLRPGTETKINLSCYSLWLFINQMIRSNIGLFDKYFS